MNLPDVNLLLLAYDASSPQHDRAREWLAASLSSTEAVAFAWVAILSFIRLSTSPRIYAEPRAPTEAFDIVTRWLSRPNAIVVHPTVRHPHILRSLLEPIGTAGNLTTDAHLAALSIEHGARLCSADGDFARFSGVRWVNPLA